MTPDTIFLDTLRAGCEPRGCKWFIRYLLVERCTLLSHGDTENPEALIRIFDLDYLPGRRIQKAAEIRRRIQADHALWEGVELSEETERARLQPLPRRDEGIDYDAR